MPPAASKNEWIEEGYRQMRLLTMWSACSHLPVQKVIDSFQPEWISGSLAWHAAERPTLAQLETSEQAFRERWPFLVRDLDRISDQKQRAEQQQKLLKKCLVESLQPGNVDLKATQPVIPELQYPIGRGAIWRIWREQAIALQSWLSLVEREVATHQQANVVQPWVTLADECKHAISLIDDRVPATGVWSMLATISAPAQTTQLRQLRTLLARCQQAFNHVPDALGRLLHDPATLDARQAVEAVQAELARAPHDWPPLVLAQWAQTQQLDLAQVIPPVDDANKRQLTDWQIALAQQHKISTDRFLIARLGGLRTILAKWQGDVTPLIPLVQAMTPTGWELTLLHDASQRYPQCIEEQPLRSGQLLGCSELGLRVQSPTGQVLPFPKAIIRVTPPVPPVIEALQSLLAIIPVNDAPTQKYGQSLLEMWQQSAGQLAEWWNAEDERCRDLWHFVQRISLWRLRDPACELAVAGFFTQLGEQGFRLQSREMSSAGKVASPLPWMIVSVPQSAGTSAREPLTWGPTLIGPDGVAIAPTVVLALPPVQPIETPLAACLIAIEPMMHSVHRLDPEWSGWGKTTPHVWSIWQGLCKAKGGLDRVTEAAALQLMQLFFAASLSGRDAGYAMLAWSVESVLRAMQVDVSGIYATLEKAYPPDADSAYAATQTLVRADMPPAMVALIRDIRDAYYQQAVVPNLPARVQEVLAEGQRDADDLEPLRPLATKAGFTLLPPSRQEQWPRSWDDLDPAMQSCARVEFATEPLGSITGLLKFAIQGYDLPVWRVSAGQPALVEPWRKASAIVQATPPGQHRLGQLLGELPRRCQMGDEESAITDIMLEFWQHIEPAWRESGHRSLGSLEEALHTLMSAFRLQAIRPLSIQERAQYENISELQPYRNIMHLICPGIQRANGQIIIKAKVEIE